LKPAQGNSSARPYLKKILHKNRAGRAAQGESPEFKPKYHKQKNKKGLRKQKQKTKSELDYFKVTSFVKITFFVKVFCKKGPPYHAG
jgi:hypothetical protein